MSQSIVIVKTGISDLPLQVNIHLGLFKKNEKFSKVVIKIIVYKYVKVLNSKLL